MVGDPRQKPVPYWAAVLAFPGNYWLSEDKNKREQLNSVT